MSPASFPVVRLTLCGLLFLGGRWTLEGAWLAASPEVITACNAAGLGATTLLWNSSGISPVQVRVNGPDGPPMTGWSAASGVAQTGEWVGAGTTFSLVDAEGRELANVAPQLACGGKPALPSGSAAASFFPLQVGNQWVYQLSDRTVTSAYLISRVTGTAEAGGLIYYVVSERRSSPEAEDVPLRERWFRVASDGCIYVSEPNGPERLWLDPSRARNTAALLEVTATNVVYASRVGVLERAIRFRQPDSSLILSNGVIAPGVGLVSRESQVIAGSSGGFAESLDLVYARIGDAVVLSSPELAFGISAESSVFRVSQGEVTNCALPCYFVACGLVPPPEDPPGTYKPCFRSRITLRNTSHVPVRLTVPSSRLFDLELADANGVTVYRLSDDVVSAPPVQDVLLPPGETNYFQQVPLYTEPNHPFPAGRYRLSATIDALDGPGFSASLDLTIE